MTLNKTVIIATVFASTLWAANGSFDETIIGRWKNKSGEIISITKDATSQVYKFNWEVVANNGNFRDISETASFAMEEESVVSNVSSNGCNIKVKIKDNILLSESFGKCTEIWGGPKGLYSKESVPDYITQMQQQTNVVVALQKANYTEKGSMGYLKEIGYKFPTELIFTVDGSLSRGQFYYTFKSNAKTECKRNPIYVIINKESFDVSYKIPDQRCKDFLKMGFDALGMILE